MKTKIFNINLWLALFAVFFLSGCSDFEEMKGQRLMIQAEALLQQGEELKAEEKLAELIALYPRTLAGERAAKKLMFVQKKREQRERGEFAKILSSYEQVLDGYRSLYAEYPRTMAVLDQSDYFFDSQYLDEITPSGYQVYLWLSDDGASYRAWCIADNKERGYAVEAAKGRLVAFDRKEVLRKIEASFQVVPVGDRLAVLQAEN